MRFWGMRPYRCHECRSRFYLPKNIGDKIVAEREWVSKNEKLADAKRARKKSKVS
jgi:hypothetical protein